jgi:peptidoglycan/xylan/chitin deacetylase (PgdA/CDA1 family)
LPKSAILLSFDNLGEASELERGTWTGQTPLGRHPSVTVALPRLLDELDAIALTATFFVEAINCELNPDAVRAIVARGHQVGVHGWRHEQWAELPPARERELLERATAAFAAFGVESRAFRPPGGGLTAQTPELLRELGYEWCSPAIETAPSGNAAPEDSPLRWLPFDWELVDAYHLMARFAPLRERRGDGAEPLDADATAARLATALRSDRPSKVVILHPFLMLDDGWWNGTRQTLRLIKELTA